MTEEEDLPLMICSLHVGGRKQAGEGRRRQAGEGLISSVRINFVSQTRQLRRLLYQTLQLRQPTKLPLLALLPNHTFWTMWEAVSSKRSLLRPPLLPPTLAAHAAAAVLAVPMTVELCCHLRQPMAYRCCCCYRKIARGALATKKTAAVPGLSAEQQPT